MRCRALCVVLLGFATRARADASLAIAKPVGAAVRLEAMLERGAVTLHEQSVDARFGDHYDPRALWNESGFYVELERRGMPDGESHWEGDIGWLPLVDCCTESEDLAAPTRSHDTIWFKQRGDAALYTCRETTSRWRAHRHGDARRAALGIRPRADGAFDVLMCGATLRMVAGESHNDRNDRWSKTTTDQLMALAASTNPSLHREGQSWQWQDHRKLEQCHPIAIDCHNDHLGVMCELSAERVLWILPGGPARIVAGPAPVVLAHLGESISCEWPDRPDSW